ncbi:MAG: flagellar export chaperone FlgN [Planctomycetota bacterium]
MSRTDTEKAERLREGLRREREIYLALAELSRKQEEILDSGASEQILDLAHAKEDKLDRIAAIERDIADLKPHWRETREQIDEALRAEVETELDQIQAVLRQLIDLEARGQANVQANQRETAEKLRQVDGGRRLHQAYRGPRPQPKSRYLDRTE